MVDVLTDNRNRTASEIRKIFEKGGGNMGSAGCVGYLFERKGIFGVEAAGTDEDTLLGIALDAGADDLKRAGPNFEVICDPAHFGQVKEALEKSGVKTVLAEITQLPKVQVDADAEAGQKVLRLADALDDHDDVQHVYTNLNVSEQMIAEMSK
jgi:YebC/PmpR family DNA-binding regulatory protein